MIIIDKPAGVPVHPTGRYNYNTVTEIMRSERAAMYQDIHTKNTPRGDSSKTFRREESEQESAPKDQTVAATGSENIVKKNGTIQTKGRKGAGPMPDTWNPMPCNRLDRLTSGLMLIGKHPAAANAMMQNLKSRTVLKEYVARVVGEFPDPGNFNRNKECEGGEIVCEQPILQISPKLGLNRVRAKGKEARTVFRRIAYYSPPEPNPDTDLNEIQNDEFSPGKDLEVRRMPWKGKRGYSIVRCIPLTGRTHQIRVHLQFLGHPITNDPIYCNQRVWGPSLGCGDKGQSSSSSAPSPCTPDPSSELTNVLPPATSPPAQSDEDIMTRLSRMGKSEAADAVAYHEELSSAYAARKAEKITGEACEVCGTELYSDPGTHELGIYLHAVKYKDVEGEWEYATELPGWAVPPEEGTSGAAL